MSTTLDLSPTLCSHGEHALVCACGDPLERLPQADEWYYRSLRTGNAQEVSTPEPLERLGWDGLAKADPGLYSILSAREKLGMLHARHNHAPALCEGHTSPLEVPECYDRPMRLAPQGWVCRVEG